MIPERIGRLDEFARNLWWTWHQPGRDLFRSLDYLLWKASGHNPVEQLLKTSAARLMHASSDPDYLSMYDSVLSAYDADLSARNKWFETSYPDWQSGPIAFFSMEFAIHNSLPIYAGGLGILAGDICKEASDLGIPLVGVGFMYPQGYFRQRIRPEGWQEEIYSQLNFDEAPIRPALSPEGHKPLAEVHWDSRVVYIKAWLVRAGRTAIYLLDTNLEENDPRDRQLTSRLYIADRELRMQQEIVLGVGGVRALRALGINPAVWHANEGHTAFMMLERIREEVEKGALLDQAVKNVRATTVFTTHTPVPSGHDVFPTALVQYYFQEYLDSLAIDHDTFLKLGQQNGCANEDFNMTVLAMRLAERRNGVSLLHGSVSRKMWRRLWPEANEDDVPITQITNGIHVPTWVAPEMARLFEKYLGQGWLENHDDARLWDRVLEIPDEELWSVRQILKRKLIYAIVERVQRGWADGHLSVEQLPAMGALLHPGVLTVGFVRRFAEYKRPALLFKDVERLKLMVTHPLHPIQIVFAGKSHPADFPSKHLLQQVYAMAKEREFQGRIAFVEDYDMHMARYLVHGVDVWLNTPRRLCEACGSSGMKASLNGVPHLSVRDGWWHEAYAGSNGWAIGNTTTGIYSADEEDSADAEALYRLLEEEIIPLYYDQDHKGVPHGWVHLVKEAIRSIVPGFCARRMLKEYATRMYVPAMRSVESKEAD